MIRIGNRGRCSVLAEFMGCVVRGSYLQRSYLEDNGIGEREIGGQKQRCLKGIGRNEGLRKVGDGTVHSVRQVYMTIGN